MAKLTNKQREALLKLASGEFAQLHIDNYSRTGVRYDVIERLGKLGYVKYINASAVVLTPAGAAAIGREDLFAENAQPEAKYISIADAMVLQDEIHARLKQETEDGLRNNAPEPDPRDAEIDTLKALVERFARFYRLLEATDMLADVTDELSSRYNSARTDNIDDYYPEFSAYCDWTEMLDEYAGLIAQYHRAGIYAPDDTV